MLNDVGGAATQLALVLLHLSSLLLQQLCLLQCLPRMLLCLLLCLLCLP